jgi:hypothetical protein
MKKTQLIITDPPKELRNAKLDNIALVPASLLPFKENYKLVVKDLPPGTVLCVQSNNPKHKKILEKVTAFFRTHQRRVITLPLERLHPKKQFHNRQAQTLRLAL